MCDLSEQSQINKTKENNSIIPSSQRESQELHETPVFQKDVYSLGEIPFYQLQLSQEKSEVIEQYNFNEFQQQWSVGQNQSSSKVENESKESTSMTISIKGFDENKMTTSILSNKNKYSQLNNEVNKEEVEQIDGDCIYKQIKIEQTKQENIALNGAAPKKRVRIAFQEEQQEEDRPRKTQESKLNKVNKEEKQYNFEVPNELVDSFDPEIILITEHRMRNEIEKSRIKTKRRNKNHEVGIEINEIIERKENLKKRPAEQIERGVIIENKLIVTIGRNDCDFMVSDQFNTISSLHAIITFDENNHWTLKDSNSKNGTYLVSKNIVLKEGIQLLIGQYLVDILSIEEDKSKEEESNSRSQITLFYKKLVKTKWCSSTNTNVQPLQLIFSIEEFQPAFIGKDYQPEFSKEESMSALHCSLVMNKHQEIVLQNEDSVFNSVGKSIPPLISHPLANESIVRFGLLKKFSIKLISKTPPTNKQCHLCSVYLKSSLFFQPCLHPVLTCTPCLMTNLIETCSNCNLPFTDYCYSLLS